MIPQHFVSASCEGERCGYILLTAICGAPATHKVEEAIMHDDPNPNRHPLVQYVCCAHFKKIVGRAAPCP
jgi:hypothetical protein